MVMRRKETLSRIIGHYFCRITEISRRAHLPERDF
jgi:hypothetical protein